MKCPPTFVRSCSLLRSSSLEGCRSTWARARDVMHRCKPYHSISYVNRVCPKRLHHCLCRSVVWHQVADTWPHISAL